MSDMVADWQRVAEEFRQSWFLSLGVLLLRNGLDVTVTSEELEKAKKLNITKFDLDGDRAIRFVGEYKESEDAGSKS